MVNGVVHQSLVMNDGAVFTANRDGANSYLKLSNSDNYNEVVGAELYMLTLIEPAIHHEEPNEQELAELATTIIYDWAICFHGIGKVHYKNSVFYVYNGRIYTYYPIIID